MRPNALEPKNYLINNKKITFPKDNKAGGTWYAVDEPNDKNIDIDDFSNVLVLLNCSEEKHVLKDNYRKSRGLIVLDLISSNSPFQEWKTIDLENIEPFTIVLFENQKLYQLRWNEMEKNTKELDANESYIWSSSTLYSKEIREQREQWFHTFLDTKPIVNEQELFHFHRYTEVENTEHGLIINRNNSLKTLSITQSIIEKNKVIINYSDLVAKQDFSNTFISL